MDFIWTANLTKLAYIALSALLVFGSAVFLEHFLGLDHDRDINSLQIQAQAGNGLPLSIVYLGVWIFYAVVVHTVLQ